MIDVRPIGGPGLSGTGPKAGGPLCLLRPVRVATGPEPPGAGADELALRPARDDSGRLRANCHDAARPRVRRYIERSSLGAMREIPGPVGERNLDSLHARGRILVLPCTGAGLLLQVGAALATGNKVVLESAAADATPRSQA